MGGTQSSFIQYQDQGQSWLFQPDTLQTYSLSRFILQREFLPSFLEELALWTRYPLPRLLLPLRVLTISSSLCSNSVTVSVLAQHWGQPLARLAEAQKRADEPTLMQLLRDCLEAIEELQECGRVHGKLTPSCIRTQEGRAKIVAPMLVGRRFNESIALDPQDPCNPYCDPDRLGLFQSGHSYLKYQSKDDLFPLGMCFLQVSLQQSLSQLYDHSFNSSLREKVAKCNIYYPRLAAALNLMLKRPSSERLTAKQIRKSTQEVRPSQAQPTPRQQELSPTANAKQPKLNSSSVSTGPSQEEEVELQVGQVGPSVLVLQEQLRGLPSRHIREMKAQPLRHVMRQ